jgi:hypothetical protein
MTIAGKSITIAAKIMIISGEIMTITGKDKTIMSEVMTLFGEIIMLVGKTMTIAGETVRLAFPIFSALDQKAFLALQPFENRRVIGSPARAPRRCLLTVGLTQNPIWPSGLAGWWAPARDLSVLAFLRLRWEGDALIP